MLCGGIPRGSLILLAGQPGTGKTILATTFLYRGALAGEKGAYLSFSETRRDYFENMRRLGMDMEEVEKRGDFFYMDYITPTPQGADAIRDAIIRELIKLAGTKGVKRLVIDSISAIVQSLGHDKAREFVHSVIGRVVKAFGVTTILIGEMPYGSEKIGEGIEEFVVDGVILLKYIQEGEISRRVMRLLKLRGVGLEKTEFDYIITSEGIRLFALPSLEFTSAEAPTDRISTGIDRLDEMLGGGVYRNSTTLILGMSGSGKTTVGLHFAVRAAMDGKKALYISFEEPRGHIVRMLQNYGMWCDEVSSNMIILSRVPEGRTPMEYFMELQDLVRKYEPEVVVIDSISAIIHHMSEETQTRYLRYLNLLSKKERITLMALTNFSAENLFAEGKRVGFTTFADNIIVMRYREVEGELRREMFVLKSRGSYCDSRIHPYRITSEGVVIE